MRSRPSLAVLALLVACPLTLRCASNSERAAPLDAPITPPGTVEREPYFVWMSDTSATIRWWTFQPATPGIRFWTEEGDTVQLVLEESGRKHSFQMSSLTPATTYSYQIQINDTLWSDIAQFRTFPRPGSKDEFVFLAMADTGTLSPGQLALAEHINEEEPALIIHAGDIAYPDGTAAQFTINHFGVYAPILKRVPLFPSPGDHEWRTNLAEPYVDAFEPPGGHASGSPFYYAFTYGNVRFISLDTSDSEEHAEALDYVGDPSSRQYQWLLVQLSAARGDPGIDWTVVFFHHSPYSASTGFGGHGSHLPTRRAIAPLMDGYRVPLVFSGHDHDYQRSKPIRANQIAEDDDGTVYIVTGGGGGRTALRGVSADWFTNVSQKTFEFVRATVDHYTMRLEAVNADGQVFDSFELTIPDERRKPEVLPTEPLTMPEPSALPAGAAGTAASQRRGSR
jgi:3',5'-cyclic AMP phosphodiesterase CpdA